MSLFIQYSLENSLSMSSLTIQLSILENCVALLLSYIFSHI